MKVHLQSIQVHDLFGRAFEGLRLDDLGEGLTVVYAPNATGKSVLAAAASKVLRPAGLDRNDHLEVTICAGGNVYQERLRGPRPEAPWPQSQRQDLYRLAVADVVLSPAQEDQERIHEALSGGIRLEQIRTERVGRRPNSLNEAWDDLLVRQATARLLSQSEAKLPDLQQQLAEAEQAGRDAAALAKWLEAAECDRRAADADAAANALLTAHPGVGRQSDNATTLVDQAYTNLRASLIAQADAHRDIARFAGGRASRPLQATDEAELASLEQRFDRLNGTCEGAKRQTEAAQQKLESARAELERIHPEVAPGTLSPELEQELEKLTAAAVTAERDAATKASVFDMAQRSHAQAQKAFLDAGGAANDIPQTQPSADVLRQAADLDAQIAARETEKQNAESRVSDARRTLELERAALPGITAPAQTALRELLQEPKIAAVMDQLRAARVRQEALNAVAQELEEQARTASADRPGAAEAEVALRDWLRCAAEPAAPRPAGLLIGIAAAAAVVSLVTGAAAGWAWGAILAVAGIAVLSVMALRRPAQGPSSQLQAQAAARVPKNWQPQAWMCDAVAATLAQAVVQLQRAQVLQQLHTEKRAHAQGVDVDGPHKELTRRASLLKEATGLDCSDVADYGLAGTVQRLLTLRQAEDELALAEQHRDEVDAALSTLLRQRDELIHRTIGAPSSLRSGESTRAWAQRLEMLRGAASALRDAQEQADTANTVLTAAKEKLTAFYHRFGWAPAEEPVTAKARFARWFAATAAARQAENELERARANESQFTQALQAAGDAICQLCHRYDFAANPADARQQTGAFRDWFDATRRMDAADTAVERTKDELARALEENGIPVALNDQVLSDEDRRALCRRRAAAVVPALRAAQSTREKELESARNVRRQVAWTKLFGRLGLEQAPSIESVREAKTRLDAMADAANVLQQEITKTRTLIAEAEKANDLSGAQQAMNRAVADLDAWLQRKQDELASECVIESIGEAVRREATPTIVASADRHMLSLTGGRYADLDAANGDVRVVDMLENRVPKTVAQLSTGTRVHLALALRLAVIEAAEANQGYAFPLLLDEVMATSDPDASKAIATALRTIATGRQIILFTNQPDDLAVLREVFGEGLQIRTLSRTAIPTAIPPIRPPELVTQQPADSRLPMESAVSQWPPSLLEELLEGIDTSHRTVHEAVQGGSARERNAAVVGAAEAVRRRVSPACRRLRWADLREQKWITQVFRERVEAVLVDANGDAREFLDGFRKVKGMRQESKDACEAWLEEQGLLQDPPTFEDLERVALEHLPAELPDRAVLAMRICRVFVGR